MTLRNKRIFAVAIALIVISIPALFILKRFVGRGFAENIFHQTVVIADASKPQTIVLRKRFFQGYIDGMSIQCSGTIEGNAKIQRLLYNSGKYEGVYNEEELTGKVHFRWGGDWYSDTAEIRIFPDPASSGSLTLTYSFYD